MNVNFTDQSHRSVGGGLPTSWLWNFGDGNTSVLQNPSHLYTSVGSYTVTLQPSSPYALATYTNYITVTGPAPVANFTSDVASGNIPLTVNFTDTSTNSPTSWLWNFGDGNTSTSQNPSHTYTSVGSYTVTLTATNTGGSNQNIKTNYITATSPTVYTLSPSDNGSTLNISNPITTIRIPPDTEQPGIGAGYTTTIHNNTTGTLSISANSPVTITSGPITIPVGETVKITKTGSNTWQTSSLTYGLLPGGNGNTINITNPITTVKVPSNTEQPGIGTGYTTTIHNNTTGTLSISANSPVTITSGPITIPIGGSTVITKTGSNIWQTSSLSPGSRVILQGAVITGTVKF